MTMDTTCIAVCREINSPVATTLQLQATSLTDPLGKTARTGFLVSSSWLLKNCVGKLLKDALISPWRYPTEECYERNSIIIDPSTLNGKMKATDNYRRRNARGKNV
jgi:hypothetical protein